jgi:hypothetical protein
MAFYLCGNEKTCTAYLNYCFSATEDLIRVNWKSVQAVAGALLEHKRLNYEETLEVIWPGTAALRRSRESSFAKAKAKAKAG